MEEIYNGKKYIFSKGRGQIIPKPIECCTEIDDIDDWNEIVRQMLEVDIQNQLKNILDATAIRSDNNEINI